LNFISLFTGIGGIDLGLEWAGMKCLGQVENHPVCRVFLERHFPEIPKWKDVRNFSRRLWRNYHASDAPNVDLIAGGFPCQDISTAGKGAGLAGKRSGLWKEFYRIIQEFGPDWVLIENVSALRTRGADRVLDDLERANYSCWPIVVGAWAAGAVHPRDRVWIVAHTKRDRTDRTTHTRIAPEFNKSGAWLSQRSSRRIGSNVADPHGEYGQGGRKISKWKAKGGTSTKRPGRIRKIAAPGQQQYPEEETRLFELKVGGTVDGLRPRVAEWCNMEAIAAYGNTVVPQVVQAIGESITRIEKVIHG
jgi:DNA (cytosine-5)-methyltransferase 1